MNSSVLITTVLAAFVASVAAGLAKHGITLDAASQSALTGLGVGAVVWIAGKMHLSINQASAAKAARIPPRQGGFVRWQVIGLLSVLGLGGCAALGSLFSNPIFIAGLQDAIEIAIGVIGDKYGVAETQKIATVAGTLAGVSSNTTVTAAQLVTQADAAIAGQNLNSDDTAALDSLVLLASAGLSTGVNAANNANPQAVTNLGTFFTDIQNAASAYAKAAPAAEALAAGAHRSLELKP